MGQYQRAISCYEDALNVARDMNDHGGEGARLGNLGSAYINLGQVKKAIEYYNQAIEIAYEIGHIQV